MIDRRAATPCGVERLESRIAPAIFVVITLADDGSAGTLRDAVQKANAIAGPDVITFAVNGTIALAGGEIDITDSLNIKGPGASRLTIDGGGQSRIFKINYSQVVLMPTAITALTLRHGHSAEDGGALSSSETTLLDRVVISGSHAEGSGGGASIETDGKGIVRHCRFVGNSAGDAGGGLFLTAGESLFLSDTIFSRNKAAGDGGGLSLNVAASAAASAVVSASTFSGNLAGHDGGGLHLANKSALKTILLHGDRVASNHAGGSGGGIAAADGRIVIDQTLIVANGARYAGGGIEDHTASLAIRGSQILANATTNSAGIGGGGLHTAGHHSVAIVASIIAKNRAAGVGGELSLTGGVSVVAAQSFLPAIAAGRSSSEIFLGSGTQLHA